MPCPISPEFDFLDASLNLERLPVEELAELRKSEPIHWVDVPGGTGGFGDRAGAEGEGSLRRYPSPSVCPCSAPRRSVQAR